MFIVIVSQDSIFLVITLSRVHSHILGRTKTVWHVGSIPRWDAAVDKWLVYYWLAFVCCFIAIQFQITFCLNFSNKRKYSYFFTLKILFGHWLPKPP